MEELPELLLYVDGGEELEDVVHDHDVGFLDEVCSVQQVVMYNLAMGWWLGLLIDEEKEELVLIVCEVGEKRVSEDAGCSFLSPAV